MLGENWYKVFKVWVGDFTVFFIFLLEITLLSIISLHYIDFTLQCISDIMLKVLTGQKSKETDVLSINWLLVHFIRTLNPQEEILFTI